MEGNLFAQIFKFYRYWIKPRVNDIRGSTFLERKLRALAEISLDKVDDNDSSSIHDFEWDNLVILDACRHDLYEEVRGETSCRITQGSTSKEFIENNFSEGDLQDTVLITANPHCREAEADELVGKKTSDIFECVYMTFHSGWDKDRGTVPPEEVYKDAMSAQKLFPNKRKIVWFMQPHHPFLDGSFDSKLLKDENESKGRSFWDDAEKGMYEKEDIWDSYRNNLSLVLKHVNRLEEKLEGRTVITSDHGNLVGENGLYGHPSSNVECLRKVPLDVID